MTGIGSVAETPSEKRLLLAFGIAPLVTVPVLVIAAVLLGGRHGSVGEFAAGAGYMSFFFTLFGLPIAYAVEIAVGVPIYLKWLRGRRHLGRVILPVSTVVGTATMPLAWHEAFGGPMWFDMAWIGAAMGLAAGLTFLTVVSLGTERSE